MASTFLPYLVLAIAPLAWVAVRVARYVSPWIRWLIALLLVLLTMRILPLEGLSYGSLKRMNLLLSSVMVGVLLLRQARAPWWDKVENYRKFLVGMAVASMLVYLNFFAFHGGHTFVHRHDVAHYYLGSKYFHEVGYGNLYTAMVRAEAEEYHGVLIPSEVRDLAGNQLVPAGRILARSDTVKRNFSPERWAAFRADVRYFREAMGVRYADLFKDHGYNPTPVWTLMGGSLANLVPAGSPGGLLLLTLLDPLLEIAVFAAVGSVFGVEALLTSLIYFCVLFGAMFNWIGGAYLRYVSFAGIIGAACCLRRDRHYAAGALLALAMMLRVFPALFLAGPVFRGVSRFAQDREVPRPLLRLVVSFTMTAAVLFLATGLTADGFGQWVDFYRNTRTHMGSVSANILGITNWPTYLSGIDVRAPGGLEAFLAWRKTVFALQLALVFPLSAFIVAVLSQRVDEVRAMALGSLLVFTGVNIPAYYYTFMLLMVVVHQRRPGRLAMLFAVEAVVYAFDLFEDHEVLLYLYKSALLLGVFVAIYGAETWAALEEIFHRVIEPELSAKRAIPR